MENQNNKVTLHRVLIATPKTVFNAFSDATAWAAWLPPNGLLCTVHEFNFAEGGNSKLSFKNFSTGASHSFGSKYVSIRSNEFIHYTDKFDDPNLQGEVNTVIRLNKVSCGTELIITQEGLPSAIPSEVCYLGWQESLDNLKRLVEPNIHQF